jgi:hypothetical protein
MTPCKSLKYPRLEMSKWSQRAGILCLSVAHPRPAKTVVGKPHQGKKYKSLWLSVAVVYGAQGRSVQYVSLVAALEVGFWRAPVSMPLRFNAMKIKTKREV